MFRQTTPGRSGLLYMPRSIDRGGTLDIQFTVSNLSTSSKRFDVQFYLSRNSVISTSDRLLGTSFGISLAAGSTRTRTRKLVIPTSVSPGTYHLGFIVDPLNIYREADESNNVQPLPYTIRVD
jgi:subtilase family serine protease